MQGALGKRKRSLIVPSFPASPVTCQDLQTTNVSATNYQPNGTDGKPTIEFFLEARVNLGDY